MKIKVFSALLVLFAYSSAFAVYEVGDSVKNFCWKTHDDNTLCLEDAAIKNHVRVLLYNAGWCGPCNQEFRQLSPLVSQAQKSGGDLFNKPASFISLSYQGWSRGDEPNKTFLESWKKTHKISFYVAGSPKDGGGSFFDDVYFPNVVIIGKNGKVAYKAINPGAQKIMQEVKKHL
jgi:peroxiredoxin